MSSAHSLLDLGLRRAAHGALRTLLKRFEVTTMISIIASRLHGRITIVACAIVHN